ncbi:Toll-9 [Carabus blaptoides fortunei]
MFLKTTFLVLQISLSMPQIYDEDIELSFPADIMYHSPNYIAGATLLGEFNNCTCKELAGVDAYCNGRHCTMFPSNVIITAKLFKLKLTSIATIRKDDLKLFSHIEALEIEGNVKLVSIEPGTFTNMSKLRNLTISSNVNFKYLDTNVFEGLVKVEMVYIEKNGFIHVSDITRALSPKYLPRIRLLDMSENMFHQIESYEFDPMAGSSLTELNMLVCELEYIHPDSLRPLKNLKALRLGQNLFNRSVITRLIQRSIELDIPLDTLNLYETGMRKIPNSLLKVIGQSNITELNLARNHFDYIDDLSFPEMPNLITLDLRDDLIVEISRNAFRKLPKLKDLLLGENNLLNVPLGVTIDTLEVLDLSGNANNGFASNYFNVQDGIFANMSHLSNLQLPYNILSIITRKTFIGLENLTKLNLKNTSLYFLENGAFLALKNLLHLNLINNLFPLFMKLTADIFEGLGNLQVLLLGGCFIKNLTITPSIFTYTPNLTYLGLEGNGIHVISPNQLNNLVKLRILNLGENKLCPWTMTILPHESLRTLMAQQNKITDITLAMLEDFQRLETLNLDGNPLTCDCSLYPVVTWLTSRKTLLALNNNTAEGIATCLGPDMWRRRSIVEYLRNLTSDPNQCPQASSNNDNIIIISVLSVVTIIAILLVIFAIYRWRRYRACTINKI